MNPQSLQLILNSPGWWQNAKLVIDKLWGDLVLKGSGLGILGGEMVGRVAGERGFETSFWEGPRRAAAAGWTG